MPLKTHHDDLPAINLTPMIDVVFNLIIFFMVCTRFSEMESSIDVSVPQVGNTAGLNAAQRSRTINVAKDGAITLDTQSVTLTELRAQLAEAHRQYSDLKVTVRGDELASHQSVAAVYAACQQAGIVEFGIAVTSGDPTIKGR